MSDAEFRPEARAPRGFADKRAADLRAERQILEAVSRVYERYGFEQLDTGAFEYADALGKFLPDSDRPNEGVFALQDDDEQWMALRYDLTAPLARFTAENWETLPKPFRRYAFGPVWRNEKPGPGRYRQFIQCDADTVGSARPEADAEMIAMATEGFVRAGLSEFDVVVKINSRKLLDGLLTAQGVLSTAQRLTVMRALDKFDRLGWSGVQDLLGAGRRDPSGDFTRGAELPIATINQIETFMAAASSPDLGRRDVLDALSFLELGADGEAGLRELDDINCVLQAMQVWEYQAKIDPTVVRGLEYYTGTVFEADLQLTTTDDKGQLIRFGSVGGGGRYDDLIARFTGQTTPATGFSFGVSRLAAALRAAGQSTKQAERGPVVVIVLDGDQMADYFAVAGELRAANIDAEVYLGTSGMRAQMKYADRRMSPAAVIIGEDERIAGTVTIKDLDLGRMLSSNIESNEVWRKDRPGQFTVKREEMVDRIRQMLPPSRGGYGS